MIHCRDCGGTNGTEEIRVELADHARRPTRLERRLRSPHIPIRREEQVTELGTILVVEDDFDVRESLKDTLEDEGYRVASAADGLEALEYLGRHAAPALILLDWMMPRCDGAEFLRRKHKDPAISEIPVILLTADIQRGGKTEALRGGTFLTKPVMLPELLAAVEKYAR